MTVACILLAIGVLCINMTAGADQENIKAIQIVRLTGNYSFQYVEDNNLEKILNSEQIKDRYVVVVSIVGRMQTGKSTILNFFLNYLRKTYNISSVLTNKMNESEHWMDMNVSNGFDAKDNINGTTKGIWAWPEIFTHDNINGHKVAIILLDTEGLFHILSNLQYNTKIFALSALFSSMQGYNVLPAIHSDTLELLDVFTSYTVYGSRVANSSTETPFQHFHFIIRDSKNSDESENATLNRIFPADFPDQNRDMKARLKSVFKTIRVFVLPYPGENVTTLTFDGSTSMFNPNFKDKIEEMVMEVLTPENIVIKEINGEQIKARQFSHFLKEFTNVVENNITTPANLVEVLANASNWMLHEKLLELYNDSMYESLATIEKNTSKPYYEPEDLKKIHSENKKKFVTQFKNQVKFGGDRFAASFEKLLGTKIDKCFENIQLLNEVMRLKFVNQIKKGGATWIMIGASIFVLVNIILYILYKKRVCRRATSQDEHDEEKSSKV